MVNDNKKRIEEIRNGKFSEGLIETNYFLLAQLDEAHAALRFYACKSNYEINWSAPKPHDGIYPMPLFEDRGQIARKALGDEDA